jgi:hypothetical protein
VGRLENIVARNRNPKRGETITLGIGIAIFVMIILALVVFTDLDDAPVETKPESPPPPSQVERRVNDVQLR